jgi:hypothetical protein
LNKFGAGGNYYGAGMYCFGKCIVKIMNSTLASNGAEVGVFGSGIYEEPTAGSILFVTNSILWDPNAEDDIEIDPFTAFNLTIDVTYSDVRGGWAGIGNMDSMPEFISTVDFHQLPNSICNNAGTLIGAPTFDLDNNSRPLPANSNPDLGCYETDQTATVIEAINSQSTFSLSPNPVQNLLTIVRAQNFAPLQSAAASIAVYDVAGRKIVLPITIVETQNVASLTTTTLPNGIYLLQIINNITGVSEVGKFVKE